jgi:hypothetical protein
MMMMNNSSENMTGRERKEFRLNHLAKKQKDLATKLASKDLTQEQRISVETRCSNLGQRIATIKQKLERKVKRQGAAAEEGASAKLKAKDIMTGGPPPPPGQRFVAVQDKLSHVRSVLATSTDLSPQRRANLEAKEQRLSTRLAGGQNDVGEAEGKSAVTKTQERVDVKTKLAHIKTVLARPALPAKRRAHLLEKEKRLTARLVVEQHSDSKGAVGGGGGKGMKDRFVGPQAKLARVQELLAKPDLPQKRRAHLEAKKLALTARLEQSPSPPCVGSGRGKGFGKGFGKGMAKRDVRALRNWPFVASRANKKKHPTHDISKESARRVEFKNAIKNRSKKNFFFDLNTHHGGLNSDFLVF